MPRMSIHWTDFVWNEEVRPRTGQPFLSDTIRGRRLSFFGHLSRADPSQDHSRALQSCILGPTRDWHCRVGRPRQSWLRTVEDDLRPLNFGLATARRRALDRLAWRLLMETATSTRHAPERQRVAPIVYWWHIASYASAAIAMAEMSVSHSGIVSKRASWLLTDFGWPLMVIMLRPPQKLEDP